MAKLCSHEDQGCDCALFSPLSILNVTISFPAVEAAADPHVPIQFFYESDLSECPLLADSLIICVRKLLSLLSSNLWCASTRYWGGLGYP